MYLNIEKYRKVCYIIGESSHPNNSKCFEFDI